MIRITTNSSLRMYRSNLMKSTNSLNSAMTKLMTQRQFSSYASNPAAATGPSKFTVPSTPPMRSIPTTTPSCISTRRRGALWRACWTVMTVWYRTPAASPPSAA